MNQMTKKIIIAFFIMILAAAAVLVGFYFLNKKGTKGGQGEVLPTTEVGKLKAKDLELKYPGTPSEVVKLYWRINKCMYNTKPKKLSDEDLKALMEQLRMLYDQEFLEHDGNSLEEMLTSFKADKDAFMEQKRFISSCIVEEDNKVQYAKVKGKECATLNVNILETPEGSETTRTTETFMCRKDSEGKWKILGWQVAGGSDDQTGQKKGKSK